MHLNKRFPEVLSPPRLGIGFLGLKALSFLHQTTSIHVSEHIKFGLNRPKDGFPKLTPMFQMFIFQTSVWL